MAEYESSKIACDAAQLPRFASRSMQMLGDEAERLTDWANKYRTPEGQTA